MALNSNFIISQIILLFINVTSNELSLSPYAFWDQNGITIAGWANGTTGSSLSQLDRPLGLLITRNDVLYISDINNHRIVVIRLNSTTENFIIGSGPDSGPTQFNQPHNLFIINTSLYILDWGNQRLQKMSLNGSDPTTIRDLNGFNTPFYFYVLNNGDIYVSDTANHRIVLFSSNATNATIVAGFGGPGSNNSQLNTPYGLFVNDDGTIYIADYWNHRIMKWFAGASFGTIVAGTGTAGTSSTQLSGPAHIIVDTNEYMYISDADNSRIMRWAPNSTCGVCIVACTRKTEITSTQLNRPHSLAFDSNGSLYVNDYENHRVQKFQILDYHISYNQPKICPNLTWDTCGITFANQIIVNRNPLGIFIDYNDTVYVSDPSHNQILVWFKESINPIKNLTVQLYKYTNPFVTIDGDIYFGNDNETGRIDKSTMKSNSSVFVIKFSGNCHGLFIDIHNTLYCSIESQHQVVKISLDDNTTTHITVAGTGSAGNEPNQLHQPWGIFVDTNFNLYVADSVNNRIQHFQQGQTNGTTVAGNGVPNHLSLHFPTDVILDANGFLYIADSRNHRIIRSGHDEFQCIVGCTGKSGSAPNELRVAYALQFDSYGNLYVTDEFNHRIQKFSLTTNSCETSTTAISNIEQTTIYPSSSQKQDQITTIEQTTATSTVQSREPPSPFFISTCPKTGGIGVNCSNPNTPCDMTKPCQNNGTCHNTNDNQDYTCSCLPGFNGTRCQFDHRPCKPNTCWNNGICNETSHTTFNCICAPGWEGSHCERKINYCFNVTCQNKGVCFPLLLNYSCECLHGSYSGRHCQITATRIIAYKIVSKSFGYVAIIAIVIVAMFIIIMDILKYCFGIDPTREDREQIQRKKQARKRKPVIQPSAAPIATIEETAI